MVAIVNRREAAAKTDAMIGLRAITSHLTREPDDKTLLRWWAAELEREAATIRDALDALEPRRERRTLGWPASDWAFVVFASAATWGVIAWSVWKWSR